MNMDMCTNFTFDLVLLAAYVQWKVPAAGDGLEWPVSSPSCLVGGASDFTQS